MKFSIGILCGTALASWWWSLGMFGFPGPGTRGYMVPSLSLGIVGGFFAIVVFIGLIVDKWND